MRMNDQFGDACDAARIEAQHRVRNTLAMVRSLLRRTARNATSVEDLEHHLDGRLAAFGRVQAQLIRNPAGTLDLELIVRDELLAYVAGATDRIFISGPEVRLPARIAETFSLAIHELVTNAVKYGALGEAKGHVTIGWGLEGEGDARKLAFSWSEHLLDTRLAPPQRSGFGTELLDHVMRYELDAEPALSFPADGARYAVRFPLEAA